MRSGVSNNMQKTMTQNSNRQELVFRNQILRTSALPVECYVCGKGISDGYAVTAKSLSNGIALFCNTHFQLQ